MDQRDSHHLDVYWILKPRLFLCTRSKWKLDEELSLTTRAKERKRETNREREREREAMLLREDSQRDERILSLARIF